MASERQIMANRRNAQQSTGPKTALGRKRSRNNAYQHGLSLPLRKDEWRKELEALSRSYAADAFDPITIELAERAAEAQVDLTRIRNVKNTMLKRALMKAQAERYTFPKLLDSSSSLRVGKEEQKYVAVRHILAELIKINRYERRAASRRDSAIRELVSIKTPDQK